MTIQFAGLLMALFIAVGLWLRHAAAQVSTQAVLSALVGLFPVGVILYAAVVLNHSLGLRERGVPRAAVALVVMGAALLFAALSDLLRLFAASPGFTPADLFYLVSCPALLAGVLLLPARRQTKLEAVKMGLDLAIVFIATALVGWDALAGLFAHPGKPGVLKIGLAAWNDFLLILAVFWLLYHFYDAGARRPALLLAGGAGLLVAYHFMQRYLLSTGALAGVAMLEVLHTASSLLFSLAGAAVLVWVRMGCEPAEQTDERQPWMGTSWWHYLPYLFVLGAYLLLLQRNFIVMSLSLQDISFAFGGVVSLVMLRQFISLRENMQLYHGLQVVHLQLQQQTVDLERVNQEMQQEIRERRRVEARLSYDALHDSLTGLSNRALFLDRLGQAMRKKKRNSRYHYAVLFLDLDSFKVVNDSLGHPSGDQLLIHTAESLLGCVRSTDTVSRLGGDEFAILLEDVGFPDDVILTTQRIQDTLSQPLMIQESRVFISVSIGIVPSMEASGRPEDILRDADLAMYQAKSSGKGRFEVFHAALRASAIARMAMENDLRDALENDEFTLWYQPIIELPRRLVGFEALVRWKSPARGMVSPNDFIPLAEETGMIQPLGRWILEKACRQAVEWLNRFPDLPPVKMSVNISGVQLKQPDFVAMVQDVLEKTHLPPDRLALEVTESVCLDGMERVETMLQELHDLGIEVQIDDFGTGYSSLSYLQRLPVYTIKIDRSFIKDLNHASSAPDIMRAIFSMVNHLGIKAVAEGIETQAQLDALRRLNCRYVQGFLLAPPMDVLHTEHWVHQNA